MSIYHHITIDDREIVWEVDRAACAAAAPWAVRSPETLEADVGGMAAYFPHWLLAGALDSKPARCPRCAALLVPRAGALRCVVCGEAGRADGLLWAGHLPALARPEPPFVPCRTALRAAGFAEVEAGGAVYLLVPLTVACPSEWPSVEPVVRYAGRWLDALGLPRAGAAHHLLGGGQACLYAYGQWWAQPIHAVLQQRVVNHLASLLKVAAGQRPEQAFIGRIHHEAWRPD
ncbi:MAG TPA: hypothetical protein VNL77_13465 [Roseiflexaceae bacterium]|nr:hypothetical protein [Roseiflexaceae bacterium]